MTQKVKSGKKIFTTILMWIEYLYKQDMVKGEKKRKKKTFFKETLKSSYPFKLKVKF